MTLAELINSNPAEGTEVQLTGYLTEGRRKHSSFLFFDLRDNLTEPKNETEPKVQIILKEWETENYKVSQKAVVVGDKVELTGKVQKSSSAVGFEIIVKTIKKI